MAERTMDGEVDECKGFSPSNVPTTNASSVRLPFVGSLDLNNRVPNTGTATPQRLRHKGRLIWQGTLSVSPP